MIFYSLNSNYKISDTNFTGDHLIKERNFIMNNGMTCTTLLRIKENIRR